MLAFLNSRIAALRGYLEEAPESGVRNRLFSLMNAQKAYRGRLDALRDSIILARRRDAQRQLQAAIEENAARQADYGGLLDAIAEVQAQKRTLAPGYRAFAQLLNERYASATLRRAMEPEEGDGR